MSGAAPLSLHVSRGLVRRLEERASRAYPREDFTLLMGLARARGDGGLEIRITGVYPWGHRVAARSPGMVAFSLGARTLSSLALAGTWHSHPAPSPRLLGEAARDSPRDLETLRGLAARARSPVFVGWVTGVYCGGGGCVHAHHLRAVDRSGRSLLVVRLEP